MPDSKSSQPKDLTGGQPVFTSGSDRSLGRASAERIDVERELRRQFDLNKDQQLHVDFQRIGTEGKIRVNVPVKFINKAASPGLKRGGVLNVVRYEVEVICPADKIPIAFEFDLTGLEIGKSIHISSVPMPEGVSPTITNRDFTVATVVPPKDSATAATAALSQAEVERLEFAAKMRKWKSHFAKHEEELKDEYFDWYITLDYENGNQAIGASRAECKAAFEEKHGARTSTFTAHIGSSNS
jgi:NADH/NAD ratio-sensing transcriptional regulator Rex